MLQHTRYIIRYTCKFLVFVCLCFLIVAQARQENIKEEMIGKLKELGNSLLVTNPSHV
jgi:hypothetical protein